MSTTLLHELELWNLLHGLTLVTSTSLPLRAMDIKLTHRASTTHLLFQSRQGWASQRYLDQFDTLVIQQLDSFMTTNPSVLATALILRIVSWSTM